MRLTPKKKETTGRSTIKKREIKRNLGLKGTVNGRLRNRAEGLLGVSQDRRRGGNLDPKGGVPRTEKMIGKRSDDQETHKGTPNPSRRS